MTPRWAHADTDGSIAEMFAERDELLRQRRCAEAEAVLDHLADRAAGTPPPRQPCHFDLEDGWCHVHRRYCNMGT